MNGLPEIKPIIVRPLDGCKFNHHWAMEFKYDGFRAMFYMDGKTAYFLSKAGRKMNRFQPLANRLAKEFKGRRLILDGEIIGRNPKTGRTTLDCILKRGAQLYYVAFDLLYENGREWFKKPYAARKHRLSQISEGLNNLLTSDFCHIHLATFVRFAMRKNVEGLVLKHKEHAYKPGVKWYKIKNPKYNPKKGVLINLAP